MEQPSDTTSLHLTRQGTQASSQGQEAPRLLQMSRERGSLAGDILYNADAIAAFIYGSSAYRRTIYNLVQRGKLPHFRLGAIICARKSVLLNWIEAQEGTQSDTPGQSAPTGWR